MSAWDEILSTVVEEFSYLGEVRQVTQLVVRLVLAAVLVLQLPAPRPATRSAG